MKRIVISGYYGRGNSGDEAILKAIQGEFKEFELTVLPSRRGNLLSIIKALSKADLLLSGGGGLLQDTTSKLSLIYYLSIILLAKILSVKVMIYAQGIGPIKSTLGRALTKFIVDKVELISIRDKGSERELKEIGIKKPPIYLTSDPVFSLTSAEEMRVEQILKEKGELTISESDPLLVGISVRPWKRLTDYQEMVAKCADYLVKEWGAKVVFIPFQGFSDLPISEKIRAKMKNKQALVLKGVYSPEELLGIIGRLDLLIGMRLHSLIMATMKGVPLLGIVYDPKVGEFLEALNLTYPSCWGEIDNLSLDDFITKIKKIQENKEQISRHLKSKAKELKALSLKNVQLAKELLKDA